MRSVELCYFFEMCTSTSDTNNQVEKVYITLLREYSVSKKLNSVFDMSSWTLKLAKRAIERSHPKWSMERVDLFFVQLFYGDSLQQKVQDYLKSKF